MSFSASPAADATAAANASAGTANEVVSPAAHAADTTLPVASSGANLATYASLGSSALGGVGALVQGRASCCFRRL